MTKTKTLEDILLTFFEEAVEYGSNSAKVFDKAIKAINHLNDLKWKKRIERNYFYGRRDGLNEALLLTKKDIIKRSKQCQKEAEKLTNLLTKAGV